MNIRLADGTAWPDPEAVGDLGWALRNSTPTREQCIVAASVISAYLHIAGHPAGTESVVRQVRLLRRTLRERGAP